MSTIITKGHKLSDRETKPNLHHLISSVQKKSALKLIAVERHENDLRDHRKAMNGFVKNRQVLMIKHICDS